MSKVYMGLAGALTLVLAQQLAGCSADVAASEAKLGDKLWNGYHADIRLVVYDDMNPNFNKRKIAYTEDLSAASDQIKAMVNGLAPTTSNLHCSQDSKVYVIEITEAGSKRRYASHNNACQGGVSYAGYIPTETLGHLAQALGQSSTN